jgi:hypothetical protein
VLGLGSRRLRHCRAVSTRPKAEVDDEKLAGRLVARLEQQGFGKLSDRQKDAKRKKFDDAIGAAEGELREVRKAEALEAIEREFAGAA